MKACACRTLRASMLHDDTIIKERKEKGKPVIDTWESVWEVILKNVHSIRGGGFNPLVRELIIGRIPPEPEKPGIYNGRYVQVDRQLLILTWLSCRAGDIENFQNGKTAMDNLESHIIHLNETILEPCGMAKIDGRHPFDYIIGQTLKRGHLLFKEDDGIGTDEILRDFFEKMEGMGVE
jgi:hypothetical protein